MTDPHVKRVEGMKYGQVISNRHLVLPVLVSVAILGCQHTDPRAGYTTRSLYDEGIKSVEVRMFATKEFRRGLEFELTEALVKRIPLDTPYKVLKGDADSVLEGKIVAVRQGVLSDEFQTGLPAEKQQQLVVDFVWKDRRSGKILAEGQGMRVVAEYTPPTGEDFFVGEQELMDKMARKIISQMRSQPW